MATMIRKQISIEPRHEALLKRLARRRNVSEAEIVREALERLDQPVAATQTSLPPDPAARAEAVRFMKQLTKRTGGKARRFRREDAYEDRLRRWR